MRFAEKVIALISRWANNIGMVFLNFLMLVITADVILRVTINRPIRGSNEMAEFIMLMIVFLSVAYTQLQKSNIAVGILFDKFPAKMKVVVDTFVYLVCLGVAGLILWRAFAYNAYLSEIGRVSLILKIPVAPFQVVMIVGFMMLCLVLVFDFINSVRKVMNK